MRIESLLACTIVASLFCCTGDHRASIVVDQRALTLPMAVFDPLAGANNDLYHWDIIQRTCALYVTIRSAALERPIPFGAGMDASMVHWNKCPGGTMIACKAVPTANGDSVVTGIPWSH